MATATLEIVIQAIDNASKQLSTIEEKMAGVSKAASSFMQVGTLMAGAGAALTGSIGVAVNTFKDFQYAMTNVQAISGATVDELAKLEEAARKFGQSTTFSATQIAQAEYDLASAGLSASESVQALGAILDLAAATQSDLATTSQIVTATLSQFALTADEAARVSDVFVQAINKSQATMPKLGDSMRYVGPIAQSLNMSLEQTTAALMALYNAGYQGEQAGTMLRAALSALLDPTKEVTSTLEGLGLTIDDINPAVVDFSQIIDRLREAGASTADVVAIFGRQAGPGMAALLQQGGATLRQFEADLKNAGNAAKEVAESQMNSLQGRLSKLKGAFQELQISIGQAVLPAITTLVEKLTGLIAWFNNLPDSVKNAVSNITLFGGTILVVLGSVSLFIGTIMKMITVFSEFGTIISTISNAFSGLGSVFASLKTVAEASINGISVALSALVANPQWLILSGIIAGVIVVIVELAKHWDDVVKVFEKTLKQLSQWFESVWKGIEKIAMAVWDAIKRGADVLVNFLKDRWSAYLQFWKTIFSAIQTVALAVWEAIKNACIIAWNYIVERWNAFVEVWQKIWTVIQTVALAVWEAIKKAAQVVVDAVVAVWNHFIDFWKKLWKTIEDIALGVWHAIEWVVDKIASLFGKIGTSGKQAMQTVVTAANNMKNDIVGHSIIPDMVDMSLKEFNRLEEAAAEVFNHITSAAAKTNAITFGVGTRTGTSKVEQRNNIVVNVKEATDVKTILSNISKGLVTW